MDTLLFLLIFLPILALLLGFVAFMTRSYWRLHGPAMRILWQRKRDRR